MSVILGLGEGMREQGISTSLLLWAVSRRYTLPHSCGHALHVGRWAPEARDAGTGSWQGRMLRLKRMPTQPSAMLVSCSLSEEDELG